MCPIARAMPAKDRTKRRSRNGRSYRVGGTRETRSIKWALKWTARWGAAQRRSANSTANTAVIAHSMATTDLVALD